MNFSTLSSFLFTLSLIIISHATLPSSGANLYESLCKEAGADNAHCMQLLKAEPRIISAKSYLELSKSILQFALKKSIEGQKYLKELMMANPNSQAIKQCATFHYDGVVGSFKGAMSELKEDTLTANYNAKVGGDGPTGCDRALAGEKINNPSIAALNSDILLLSQLAFLATNKLPITIN